MSEAIDRGVPLAEIKRRCALIKDIENMEQGVSSALGLEH
jgi:hypothetical protein